MTRIGSLFSGYGGLDMAVQSVIGGTVAWVCDNDPGASRILAHHHPDVPNLGDITAVDWSAVEPIDVLTLGFPCQDISSAGKRAGIRPGTRSGLWTQAAYAISVLRPRLVVIENVRNLVNAPAHSPVEPCPMCLGDGSAVALRALGAVLGDLADLGFDADWYGFPASAVGAPHERWREFVAAYPAGEPWGEWHGDGGASADAGRLRGESGRESAPGQATGREPQPVLGERGRVGAGITLMPTPSVADSEGGHLTRSGARSSELLLPGVARELGGWVRGDAQGRTTPLLPTPAVNDMGEGKTVEAWDEWTAAMKAKHGNGNGHGPSLSIEAQRLLPTPLVADARDARQSTAPNPRSPHDVLGDVVRKAQWGKYAAAIHRWESLTRPAPAPTQPSSKGTPQLAPRFSEWMMGLPLGHVTNPAIWDGMTDKRGKPATDAAKRNAQLKAIGNGVVHQQAAEGLRTLLAWGQEAVA